MQIHNCRKSKKSSQRLWQGQEKLVQGTGGEFDFYELGLPLFDDNQNLNEESRTEKIREYIWFSETRTPFKKTKEINYFLGKKEIQFIISFTKRNNLTTLDFDALELIKTKGEQYVFMQTIVCYQKILWQKTILFSKKYQETLQDFNYGIKKLPTKSNRKS